MILSIRGLYLSVAMIASLKVKIWVYLNEWTNLTTLLIFYINHEIKYNHNF